MPTTPTYGFRYQALTDTPNGATLGQNLATDVEAKFVVVDAAAAAGTANVAFLLAKPIAHLRQTSIQTLTTSTWTAITWQTEDVDSVSGHSGSASTYTCQRAGWYRLSGGVSFAANAVGIRDARWVKNGTVVNGSEADVTPLAGSSTTHLTARSILVLLAVGNTVELEAFQSSGGNLSTASSGSGMSSMSVEWVSN